MLRLPYFRLSLGLGDPFLKPLRNRSRSGRNRLVADLFPQQNIAAHYLRLDPRRELLALGGDELIPKRPDLRLVHTAEDQLDVGQD